MSSSLHPELRYNLLRCDYALAALEICKASMYRRSTRMYTMQNNTSRFNCFPSWEPFECRRFFFRIKDVLLVALPLPRVDKVTFVRGWLHLQYVGSLPTVCLPYGKVSLDSIASCSRILPRIHTTRSSFWRNCAIQEAPRYKTFKSRAI